jgi:hypothetical protein
MLISRIGEIHGIQRRDNQKARNQRYINSREAFSEKGLESIVLTFFGFPSRGGEDQIAGQNEKYDDTEILDWEPAAYKGGSVRCEGKKQP